VSTYQSLQKAKAQTSGVFLEVQMNYKFAITVFLRKLIYLVINLNRKLAKYEPLPANIQFIERIRIRGKLIILKISQCGELD
tara:strand:- start:3854 stop:4099 length:246 start_codon:yes stop_codon:yes gene_type:complete